MSKVFNEDLVASVAREMKVADLQNATIGDILLVASRLEELTGIPLSGWIRALRVCRPIGLV